MDKNYLKIIGLHVLIGLLIFQFKILGELYFYGIIVYFFFKIISAKPSIKPIIIFQACGYVISSEIILRMTGSGLFYESSKYLLILLSVLGLIYNGFNKKAAPYIFYIILLIPSVYISLYSLDVSVNIRKAIAFNLSDSELTKLITKRTKIYSKAQFKINCHKLKKTEIVKKILKIHEHN